MRTKRLHHLSDVGLGVWRTDQHQWSDGPALL